MIISDLDVRAVGANKWRLLSHLIVSNVKYNCLNDSVLIIPKDFVTDFASIPNWVQSIIQKDDRHKCAAVVHDWLYCLQPCSRFVADEIFLLIMKKSKVSSFKRYSMYYAVRIFGTFVYKKSKYEIEKFKELLLKHNLTYPSFKEQIHA
jgi:hypothetical protein